MPSSNSLVSQIALGILLSAASLGLGFYLGLERAASAAPNASSPKPSSAATKEEYDEDEDEDEEIADGDLAAVQAGMTEPCKLVLVVRTDLKMTSGKISAQCGHATLACYKALVKMNPKLVRHWEVTGQAKIALKATSEDQLHELEAIAKSLNLCARAVEDQGLTQVAEGTKTVLGIGPAPVALINQVTGSLRLL